MSSFETGTSDHVCPHCESEYIVEWQDFPQRDSGRLICEVCQGVMKTWKGTRDYTGQHLKKRGPWPKP